MSLEEDNPLHVPASMQGETSMGGLGLSVSCTGKDLEDDDDDDDIELLRSMAAAKQQQSCSVIPSPPRADNQQSQQQQQQEAFSVVVQQPSGTSSIGDSFAYAHARQTTEEGSDWSNKQPQQQQQQPSTQVLPEPTPPPQPPTTTGASPACKRVIKKVTISPQALESQEAEDKQKEQMKALSQALVNNARIGETTTMDGGFDDQGVAGVGDLQSTINPTPEQILQSKMLLRKESKGSGGQSGTSLRGGEDSSSIGGEGSQQWGSLVHKPMKARPQFYQEDGDSTTPSTHLPGIKTEVSLVGEYSSSSSKPAATNNISKNSPPTVNLTQSHSSSISGGLTNGGGTAPSSSNSLQNRIQSEQLLNTSGDNTPQSMSTHITSSPPSKLPPLK